MARYFLRFRHSDTGLTPTFTFFKKASDLSDVGPQPPFGEVASGTYYFDYSPTEDIIFEVDGGDSIPTEEVRYISDTLSPKDVYLDQPTSQVKDDVWNDAVDRGSGTKGGLVEDMAVAVAAINVETDPSSIANAVWNELLASHNTAGSAADIVKRALKVLKNRTKIDTTADTLTVYDDDGTTPLYVFNLKDKNGAASGESPFERVPA